MLFVHLRQYQLSVFTKLKHWQVEEEEEPKEGEEVPEVNAITILIRFYDFGLTNWSINLVLVPATG